MKDIMHGTNISSRTKKAVLKPSIKAVAQNAGAAKPVLRKVRTRTTFNNFLNIESPFNGEISIKYYTHYPLYPQF